jgi:hypothetical protein
MLAVAAVVDMVPLLVAVPVAQAVVETVAPGHQ